MTRDDDSDRRSDDRRTDDDDRRDRDGTRRDEDSGDRDGCDGESGDRDGRSSRRDDRGSRRSDRDARRGRGAGRDGRGGRRRRDDPLDLDLELTALDGSEVDRLLSLGEEAATPGVSLDGEDLDEAFSLLEEAGVDVDATGLDDEALEARLADAVKIARLFVAARANARRHAGEAGLRTGVRLLDAVVSSGSPAEFVEETGDIARDEFERLGIDVTPGRDARESDTDDGREPVTEERLRERGDRLFERSADVDHEEPVHPAHDRILDELAPDEARILRVLAEEGPQAAVDVRDKGLLPLGSELVASDLTMLGVDAGCRYEERTAAYVTNLQRLGLVWIADEPLEDLKDYQVLAAQPHVSAAMEEARRPTTVRRSVHLTPLGEDFCRTVLSVDVTDDHSTAGYVPPDDT